MSQEITDVSDHITMLGECKAQAYDKGNTSRYVDFQGREADMKLVLAALQALKTRVEALEGA